MTIAVGAVRYRFPDGAPFEGIGIVPDVTVERRIADIAAGRDAVLARAEGLASRGCQALNRERRRSRCQAVNRECATSTRSGPPRPRARLSAEEGVRHRLNRIESGETQRRGVRHQTQLAHQTVSGTRIVTESTSCGEDSGGHHGTTSPGDLRARVRALLTVEGATLRNLAISATRYPCVACATRIKRITAATVARPRRRTPASNDSCAHSAAAGGDQPALRRRAGTQ